MSANEKITVRVVLPVSGIAHDVKLHANLRIRDAVPTLIAMLEKQHEGGLLLSREHLLCRSGTGEVLGNPDATLESCGVRDSDLLYLV